MIQNYIYHNIIHWVSIYSILIFHYGASLEKSSAIDIAIAKVIMISMTAETTAGKNGWPTLILEPEIIIEESIQIATFTITNILITNVVIANIIKIINDGG